MGNTDNSISKKCSRKIRIRLTDPNNPDSYVCEIFETSFEGNEISQTQEPLTEETSKPKDYFEVLMSKKLKSIGVINSKKNKPKLSMSDDEIFEKSKKSQKSRNLFKQSLMQSIQSKPEKRKLESDSSEDESLLQIQKKCESKKLNANLKDNCIVEIVQETIKTGKTSDRNVTFLKSSKIDLSQKKTFNILNYFSKTEGSLKKVKFNEEISAVKNEIKASQAPKCFKTAKDSSKQSIQVEEKKFLSGINKENVKLAPLFWKKECTLLDDAQQKARLDFLYNSSPSVLKKSNNKITDSFLSFPKVFHIQQRNDSVWWSQRNVSLPLCDQNFADECKFDTAKKFNLKIDHLSVPNFASNNPVKVNKNFFHKAKCKYVELNINSILEGLKEKNEKYFAQVEAFEKLKIEDDKQKLNDEIGFEELNVLWTEKYKPKSCEILGNDNVVKKFKKWLQSWKSFDEELEALVKFSRNSKKEKDTCSDSDDDFLSSENEFFGLKAPCNVCIISGPSSCGKTALVYALANELEFGILELNASSKRTGKKVLSDLQEATQSHKVHRVNLPQVKSFKEINKTKRKKGKKRKKTKELKKVLDQTNHCKISLILIEDADIVFDDHDEGFISAINSLVQTSKRPLIFLSNVPDCQCLYNFKTEQCLVLKMEPPCFYESCAVLDIVTQLEGECFDRGFIESLVCYNNFDLRKCLLQLQFWMHSSQNPVDFQKEFDLGRLWWGLSMFLYDQKIKHLPIPKSRKRKKVSDLFDSSDDESEMTEEKMKENLYDLKKFSPVKTHEAPETSDCSIEFYLRVLDAASILDRFCLFGSSEPLPVFEYKPKDSLSLDENMEDAFCIRKSLGEKLSHEVISLSAGIFAKKTRRNENEGRTLNYLSPSWEEIRWRNSQEKASEELSTLVSLQKGRDERSLHLDYLPILRNICRIERNRSEMNPKRKNRFYHYLNNIGLELTDENLEINCNVFYQ